MEGEPARVDRMLVLRSTRAMHALVESAPILFQAAYPARTADAVACLTGATTPWPGAAIVWVDVRGSASRLLEGPPRGVPVGR